MGSLLPVTIIIAFFFGYFNNIVWLFNTATINTGYEFVSLAGVIVPPLGVFMGFSHIL